MALSCTPTDLAAAARCYCELTRDEREAIRVYLLAVIAGKSGETPDQLLSEAKCFCGLNPQVAQAISVYLECLIANA